MPRELSERRPSMPERRPSIPVRRLPRAAEHLHYLEEEYASQPLDDDMDEEVRVLPIPAAVRSHGREIPNTIDVNMERAGASYFHMAVASASLSGKTFMLFRLAKRMLGFGIVESVYVLTRNEVSAKKGYPFAGILPFSNDNLQTLYDFNNERREEGLPLVKMLVILDDIRPCSSGAVTPGESLAASRVR